MEALGTLLLYLGGIIALIAHLWFLVVVFQTGGCLWGIIYLFIPLVGILTLTSHWDEAKIPFFMWIAGGLLYGCGAAMGGI